MCCEASDLASGYRDSAAVSSDRESKSPLPVRMEVLRSSAASTRGNSTSLHHAISATPKRARSTRPVQEYRPLLTTSLCPFGSYALFLCLGLFATRLK